MMRTLICFILLVFLAGCGYSNTGGSTTQPGYQWHSLYRENIRTVAVPIFTNKDFHRGVEFSLTEAVIKQLEAQTPYKVVPRERADTILEAQIVSVRVQPVSFSRDTALPQEQLLSMRINFIWKEIRTGRILVERRDFEQTATYYPSLAEGSFVGSQVAIERLALAIVQQLQSDW